VPVQLNTLELRSTIDYCCRTWLMV